MLTDARITAIVPTTDLARAKTFYGETLGLTDSGASAPGPQVIYRCGGGTLLEVYERPTAGDAQHTLASWEVDDVRGAVDGLRSRGVPFEDYNLPEFKTGSPRPATSRPHGFAIPTATSSVSTPRSARNRAHCPASFTPGARILTDWRDWSAANVRLEPRWPPPVDVRKRDASSRPATGSALAGRTRAFRRRWSRNRVRAAPRVASGPNSLPTPRPAARAGSPPASACRGRAARPPASRPDRSGGAAADNEWQNEVLIERARPLLNSSRSATSARPSKRSGFEAARLHCVAANRYA
jgi:catechol 2,3-dioxygenase-like lactoylglutathione lyase family enzyme